MLSVSMHDRTFLLNTTMFVIEDYGTLFEKKKVFTVP